MYIKNGFKRFLDPTNHPDFSEPYIGTVENFHFPTATQFAHYKKIKELLEHHGIHMTEIRAGTRNGLVTFIVTFNNPNIIWRKYEATVPGGYQNNLYFKKLAIKACVFVDHTPERVRSLLQAMG